MFRNALKYIALFIGLVVVTAQTPSNPESWLNIPFNELPGIGSCRTFGHVRTYIKNCSLPCWPETHVWTGQYLNYDPCPIEPNYPNGCRVTAVDTFYCGSSQYVQQHPNTPLASYFNQDDVGTPMNIAELTQWGQPLVYDNIPMENPLDPINPMDTGTVLFSTGDYDTGPLEYGLDCFAVASRGHVCVTVAYCNGDYTEFTAEIILNVRVWDFIQADAWLTQQGVTPGSIFYRRLTGKKIMAGHSYGGAAALILTSSKAAQRFNAQLLPGVVATVFVDSAHDVFYADEIAEVDVPCLILGSSQYDPIAGNRRGLALQGNKDVYVVMMYNSAHQDKEWGAEMAGFHARKHGLNVSGDAFSWYGNPEPGEYLYPTAVAYEDGTGKKWPANNVSQALFLSQFEVDMHFLGVWIDIYLNGNTASQAHLTFTQAQNFLRNRGQFWAHFSCGPDSWGLNAVAQLTYEYDTYAPYGLVDELIYYINAGILLNDGNFTYSQTQQTANQLIQCLLEQGRPLDAEYVLQSQLILQNVHTPKVNPHTLGKTWHMHVNGFEKPLPKLNRKNSNQHMTRFRRM